ncbi:hypothetical protein [Chryseobacterium glaciei]|nr:hypothetical protein [Chryseobacterium glaciei]
MKTTIQTIFIFCCILIKSQSGTDLSIKDIDNTQSVSMALLDNSPSIVFANSIPKQLSLNTNNLSNLSVEVTPFYYLNKKKYEGYEFFGLKDTDSTFKYESSGFHNLSKITLSLNAIPKDSATTIAFGARTNILTLYNSSPKELHELFETIANDDEITEKAKEKLKEKGIDEPSVTTDEYEKYTILLEKEKDNIKKELKVEEKLSSFINQLKNPMVTLDVSGAYSSISPNNRISSFRTDRYGIWSTLGLSFNLNKDYTRFFKFYFFLRYLKDNYIEDKILSTSQFTDFGLKLQVVLSKKFSTAYEYVKRNGDGGDYRSVGQIQWKFSNELTFNGGFGKNFEISNTNLITFLGISWGFVNNPKTKN